MIQRKAAIFDMDGVLLQTDEYHYQSWRELATAHQITFSRETFDQRMRGLERPAALEVFLAETPREFPNELRAQLAAEKQQRFLEIVRRQGVEPLPGVSDLLQELRRFGAAVGVGSSSRNTRFLLEAAHLLSEVDVVVDANQFRGKPQPDIFLEVARQLAARPADCVVIEDALDGIEAARRAKMAVLAVGPRDRFDENQHWVPSLAGVSADWLLQLAKG